MFELLLPYLTLRPMSAFVITIFSLQIVKLCVARWQARRKVAILGATLLPVGLPGPLGIGFFYESMKRHRQNASLEMWEDIFDRNGGAAIGNYAAEQYVLGGKRLIMTEDPENVKPALATDFGSWGKGQQLYENFCHFLGDGILSTDGEKWHAARGLMRPLFNKAKLADLDLFEDRIQRLIPSLGHGEVKEVDDLIFRFTLDTISAFLLFVPINPFLNQS